MTVALDLKPKSAFAGILGEAGDQVITIDGSAVRAHAGDDIVLVSPLKGKRAEVAAGLASLVGSAPGPLQTAVGSGMVAIWTEPHQWMVRRPISNTPLVDHLKGKLGANAAVFSAGQGRVSLIVAGAKVEWVMAKLVGLDMHADAFKVGMAQTSMLAHVATLIRRTSATEMELTFMRSYARHVTEAVLEACREG